MRRFLLSSILACTICLGSNARADECVDTQHATADSTCVLQDDGRHVVLSLALADQWTKLATAVPGLREQVARYEQLTAALKVEASEATAAAAARRTEADERQKALAVVQAYAVAQAKQIAESEASASAWYRSPWLWFGVGAALGAGGVTAIALAVHR